MESGSLSAVFGLSGAMLDFLARQSLYAAAVAVVVWTVLAIVKPRHPLLHLALWWFVLARLVLPADFSTPWSLRSSAETLLTQVVWPMGEPHVNVIGGEGSVRVPSPPPVEVVALPVEETVTAADWMPLALFLFWLGGAAAMSILLARAERSARHAIRMAEPADDPLLQQLVDAWAQRFRVSRRVRLLVTHEATAPFTAGLFRPVIVLPRTLLSRLDAVEMSAVIGHEMSHIRSYDVAWRMAERVLLVLFFFHPLVWMAVRRIDTAREAACDIAAANSGLVARTSYARGLLAALKAFRIEPEAAFARTLSIRGGTSDGLKTRLVWLKGETSMSTGSKLLGTIGIVGLGMLVLPMAEARHAVPEIAAPPAPPTAPAAPVPAPFAAAAPAAVEAVPVPPSAPAVRAAQAPVAPRAAVAPVPAVPAVPAIDPEIEVDLGEDFEREIEREVRLANAEAAREARLAAEQARREARLAAEQARREARLAAAEAARAAHLEAMRARRAGDEARREARERAAEARREALHDAAEARREAEREARDTARKARFIGEGAGKDAYMSTTAGRRFALKVRVDADAIRKQTLAGVASDLRATAQQMRAHPERFDPTGKRAFVFRDRDGVVINVAGDINDAAAELEAEADRLERQAKGL